MAAQADTKIGTYTINPSFTYTLPYNPLNDMLAISQRAKEIVSKCSLELDRIGCVSKAVSASSGNGLTWSLNSCQNERVYETITNEVSGIMQECSLVSSSEVCRCGSVNTPSANTYLKLTPQNGAVSVKLFDKDGEIKGSGQTVSSAALMSYDSKTKTAAVFSDSQSISDSSCVKSEYCTANSHKLTFVYVPVSTPVSGGSITQGGPAILVSTLPTEIPSCPGKYATNKFAICVQTDKTFPQYNTLNKKVQDEPLRYRFAITAGPEYSVLYYSSMNSNVQAAEAELKKPTYSTTFNSPAVYDTFRSFALAVANYRSTLRAPNSTFSVSQFALEYQSALNNPSLRNLCGYEMDPFTAAVLLNLRRNYDEDVKYKACLAVPFVQNTLRSMYESTS